MGKDDGGNSERSLVRYASSWSPETPPAGRRDEGRVGKEWGEWWKQLSEQVWKKCIANVKQHVLFPPLEVMSTRQGTWLSLSMVEVKQRRPHPIPCQRDLSGSQPQIQP